MAFHSQLSGSELHEPKGVSSASINTVYVADGAGSGAWELLDWSAIDNRQVILQVKINDISTAGSVWVVSPINGSIVSAYSVIDGAITASDATLTLRISGVAVTDGSIVIAEIGSAAGIVDICTPSGSNSVTSGQAIEVSTNGASTGTVSAVITIVVEA